MQFRIADTFTASLTKLNRQEQKSVKNTVFDLQIDPSGGGLSFHKLDRAKDKNFWSVRVNRDIRIIVHRTSDSFLVCYTDHHDKAYEWAERRKLETHPKTGAAQFVQIREMVEDQSLGRGETKDKAPEPIPYLKHVKDDELLSYGVPEEWVNDIKAATEDSILALVEYLPAEAAEAVLRLAVGENPEPPQLIEQGRDPFAHPDAKRRFRVFSDDKQLQQALDAPWDQWAVFLHPDQEALVSRTFNGPARVTGTAGTGKTVVAVHRAVHLARANPNSDILLTTFTDQLANDLRAKVSRLAGPDANLTRRIVVQSLDELARILYTSHIGPHQIAPPSFITDEINRLKDQLDEVELSTGFIVSEWAEVVDNWQIRTLDEYKNITRLGRRKRLGAKQREALWPLFEDLRGGLKQAGLVTWATLYQALAELFQQDEKPRFEFAVVDEAQDLSVSQLRFLAAATANKGPSLFFAGDIGQRIFQAPFSWRSLGIDIRGRSVSLKVNYRTSHQIRSHSDRLLPRSLSDVDGVADDRSGVVSVFSGPPPQIELSETESDECQQVAGWLNDCLKEGRVASEIAIFVRSEELLPRAKRAAEVAKLSVVGVRDSGSGVVISTMHDAKGLEFPSVCLMACDEHVIPDEARIARISDEKELEEVYNTERHLLYVAATRARDRLLISGVKPGSEFMSDFRGN